MAIVKFFASKDNTITNAFLPGLRRRATSSNQGASDIIELHSIYGQSTTSSVEKTRFLIHFPTSDVLQSRTANNIPASGSVEFFLRLFNARHNTTTPEDFSVSVTPLLQPWTEGIGLDMETYSDLGASNWLSCSKNLPWSHEGGTDSESVRPNLTSGLKVHSYSQSLASGLEDLEIDLSELTELWLEHESGASIASTSSLTLTGVPSNEEKFKLLSTSGESLEIIFSTSSATTGSTSYVERAAGNITSTRNNLVTSINNSSLFSAEAVSTNALKVTQAVKGHYGNTKISSSAGIPITIVDFNAGSGIVNNGVLVKLSGSAESGDTQVSYYTKKFFARNSQFFFKKPVIEARSALLVNDDRGAVFRSSSVAPAADNLNKIYLYNNINGVYRDLPTTGSALLVRFVPDIAQTPVSMSGGSLDASKTFVTASRHSTGIYEVEFAYNGAENKLRDVWQYQNSGQYIELVTGSSFNINNFPLYNSDSNSEYVFNITNLKSIYTQDEDAKFRVHTKKKNSELNVYTVATGNSKVTNIKDVFYKITRTADDVTVINYSTGSGAKYSKLSYDISGSYFDFDMSILEPNYQYEICFLRQEDTRYIQQKEKFRFRVEKY
tara:strand:+ start:3911 stop:5737 length:1827 start_codon:yes stop_codon:yes gene_type:complete